jgi:uncharacterized protein with HEPN domain
LKRDVTLYLADILENIDDAAQFISGLSFKEFSTNKLVANAVVRSIEVIGEATKHVPENIRTRKPEVPWKEMAGMRDKCIHDYVGIDYESVIYITC